MINAKSIIMRNMRACMPQDKQDSLQLPQLLMQQRWRRPLEKSSAYVLMNVLLWGV